VSHAKQLSIRALVVDDEAPARRYLTLLLRRDPDIGSVIECESGSEASGPEPSNAKKVRTLPGFALQPAGANGGVWSNAWLTRSYERSRSTTRGPSGDASRGTNSGSTTPATPPRCSARVENCPALDAKSLFLKLN